MFRFALVFIALLVAGSLRADVDATIQKARDYVGGEAAIEALRTVHYVGTLESIEQTDAGPTPVTAAIEIMFMKPYRQRIVARSDERVEITALDDYEGWQRIEDPKDDSRWRMTLLSKDQIKRLRANTWENLSFFRGLERRGGEVEDLGMVALEGRQVHKIAFIHDPQIIFYRYFDPRTGKLVLTETEKGGKIREDGEMIVGGLKFPRRVITTNLLPDGSERTVTVSFDKVLVNENLPADLFEVPGLLD